MPGKAILASKQKALKKLVQDVEGAESIVFSDYQGLTVAQDTEMRKGMRDNGVEYAVVKNTLALRAFEQLGITGLEDICKGPTAIAWSKEDVTLAPRMVKEYVDKFKKTKIKGGVVYNELSDLETITALSNIPPIETLYGQLVSSLIFPVTSLAMTLNALAEKAAEEGKEQVADLVAPKTEEAAETTTDAEEPAADAADTETAQPEEEAADQTEAPAAEAKTTEQTEVPTVEAKTAEPAETPATEEKATDSAE